MKKFIAAGAVATVAAAALIAPAQAYPPGTKMRIGASSSTVNVKQNVTFTVTRAKPGCAVTFTIGSNSFKPVVTADGSGTAVTVGSFSKAGKYTVSASTRSGSCGGEKASTTVTVREDKKKKSSHS